MTIHSATAGAAAPQPRNLTVDNFAPVLFFWPISVCALAAGLDMPELIWLLPACWYLLIPLLDKTISTDSRPNGTSEPVFQAALGVLIVTISLFGSALIASTHGLGPTMLLCGGVFVGIVMGQSARLFGPLVESGSRRGRFLGMACSVAAALPHGYVVEAVVRQRFRATPSDPFSARMGESFYQFAQRAVAGIYRLAFRVDHPPQVNPQSDGDFDRTVLWRLTVLTFLFHGLFAVIGGYSYVVFALIAVSTSWLVHVMNYYLESYGIQRAKVDDGTFVAPDNSYQWHFATRVSQIIAFDSLVPWAADAFAESHAKLDDAHRATLQIPFSLPVAQIVSLVPKWWFSVMDPKVAHWAGQDLQRVNIDGDRYANLMALYHRPDRTAR